MVSQIVLRLFLFFALSFESKIEKTFREREENNNILSRILSIIISDAQFSEWKLNLRLLEICIKLMIPVHCT